MDGIAPRRFAYSRVSSTLGCAQRIPFPIRVVVGEVPRLLRDIIADAIAREPDMMLVDESSGDIETLVRGADAEVAIVAGDPPDSGARHRQMLVEHPELKILVVTEGGRAAQLLEFRKRLMSDVSPLALVMAIRDAVTESRGRA